MLNAVHNPTQEQTSPAVSAPSAPPLLDPATFETCDECDRPINVPVCVECGEWSHDFKLVGARGDNGKWRRVWLAIPLDHFDCQEGLGWREEQNRGECPYCEKQAADAYDQRMSWKYGAGNY